MVQVLKQCGNDLSRENVMKQAANIKDFELPMLLPGIKINTSPDNFSPIRQEQLARFNGESWELFGDFLRVERTILALLARAARGATPPAVGGQQRRSHRQQKGGNS